MKRFLIGFLIGAPIGAGVVFVVTPASGKELLRSINARFAYAREAGQRAAALREEEMWAEFREKLKHAEARKRAAPPSEDGHYSPPTLPLLDSEQASEAETS